MAPCASVLTLLTLWSLTHRYMGLTGDAELYAVQAMSRIHTGLAADLFLSSQSQDKYTLFSPLYAWCIRLFGLPMSAVTLLAICKIWFFAASWTLVRSVSDVRIAYFSLALIMTASGIYGGYGVFHYAEDWLTARSLAEALAVTAISLHVCYFKHWSLLMAGLACLVHPIMALPGLLVLACLRVPHHVTFTAIAMGILAALVASLWGQIVKPATGLFTVLDPAWLEVVQERSVYLFLQFWTTEDWANSVRPLVCLGITAAVIRDPRIKALCSAAALVGGTGLAVAYIVGMLGQVAILMQAQLWRAMWITCLLSVLFSIPTAKALLGDNRCGQICVILLIGGWILQPIAGLACMALSWLIWLFRQLIDPHMAVQLRRLGTLVAVVVVTSTATAAWRRGMASDPASVIGGPTLEGIKDVAQVPAFLGSLLVLGWLARARAASFLALLTVSLGGGSAVAIQSSLKGFQHDSALTATNAFVEWRQVIPPTSNVFLASMHYSAALAWFTLQRPNYLSVDQSAGVVFSRKTALEVERRSLVLSPLLDPSWRLRSGNVATAPVDTMKRGSRPLTKDSLVSICNDPQLGFVVSSEEVDKGNGPSMRVGKSNHWNLYSCEMARSVLRTD